MRRYRWLPCMLPVLLPGIWPSIGHAEKATAGRPATAASHQSKQPDAPEAQSSVRAWEEPLVIPTYTIGPPERNPMFYTQESYQGALLWGQTRLVKMDRLADYIIDVHETARRAGRGRPARTRQVGRRVPRRAARMGAHFVRRQPPSLPSRET